MKVFYVFGTDKIFPYYGGWIEIEASTMNEAHVLFRKFFPDRIPGVLRCADYYSEEHFARTDMPTTGVFGAGCYAKFRQRPDGSLDYQICDCRAYKKGGARHVEWSDKLPASYRQIKSPGRGDV